VRKSDPNKWAVLRRRPDMDFIREQAPIRFGREKRWPHQPWRNFYCYELRREALGVRAIHPHLYRRKQGLDKIGFHIDGMLILDAQ
jgi:hypothetical protein